jgi:hypothetical protein
MPRLLYLWPNEGAQSGQDLSDGPTRRLRCRLHLEFRKTVAELEDDRRMNLGVFGTVGMQLHVLQNEAKEFCGLECAAGRLTHKDSCLRSWTNVGSRPGARLSKDCRRSLPHGHFYVFLMLM